jgi:tripeptide aminopeptidase
MINKAFEKYTFTSLDRFLNYVTIDTQSDPESKKTPSTEKQKDLAQILVAELIALGVKDAHMDEYGYVYATLEAINSNPNSPTICFCSHMDTSPDCSGKNVKPIIHKNYTGQDIVLPDDTEIVIKSAEHPELIKKIGHDIVTASGLTLLGADNKAGIAAIMDAVNFWISNPQIQRPTIKILFTPDEEIGRGVDKVDLKKLNATFAYTIDGESAGSLENETFSADALVLKIKGISAHPGFAKGKLVSALKVASEIIANLPKEDLSPETTELTAGFIHPVNFKGGVEEAEIQFILRSFIKKDLSSQAKFIERLCKETIDKHPGSSFEIKIVKQYRNMKEILDQHPKLIEYAIEAIKQSGLQPLLRSIRGGTDGSRLSFMGLPCPNIFAGEHAFHSKQEWVTKQDMQKSTETIVRLASLWAGHQG